jgi:uroporphyrinogen-III decarboxylase
VLKTIGDTIEMLRERRPAFEEAAKLQMKVWNKEPVERQPLLLSCSLDEEDDRKYPDYNTKEVHYDSQKMFMHQFRAMMTAVYGGAQAVPSVRANMGCGIFPSLFGIRQELFEDKMPWVQEHLTKEQLMAMGPEDLKIGDEFKAGLEHMAYMAEQLEGTGCMVYPMDLQGPFDTAHLVYGDAIFYDLYDDPEFVHHLLDLSCHAIFMGMEECFKVIPRPDVMVAHYNGLVIPRNKGGIKTSEDTSTLLSKEHIQEFIVPYLDRLLNHFGGGYVHFCGKNPHLLEAVMGLPKVLGINLGNPEKHDMEALLRDCAERDKVYYGSIPRGEAESLEEYFSKYLRAAQKGDRNILLLTFSCRKDEREAVLEAWNKAAV